MAKVKAPLFGLEARGKLADTLVYFPWKGIQAVRSWVIPANPKTADQQTQRGYMSDAVAAFKGTGFTAEDVSSLRRWARIHSRIMTWVNRWISYYLDERVAGRTPQSHWNVRKENIGAATFDGKCDTVADKTGVLKYGLVPTNLFGTAACSFAAGVYTCTPVGLASKTNYYFQICSTDASVKGCTGIDLVKTT